MTSIPPPTPPRTEHQTKLRLAPVFAINCVSARPCEVDACLAV